MRLLLDTHVAIWALEGDRRFSERAREAMIDEANQVLLSAAVVWEVAIKRSLGKLDAAADMWERLLAGGAFALPITFEHADAVGRLPWHHRDPFDRLLVAQAQIEKATLVSKDDFLRAYDVAVLW